MLVKPHNSRVLGNNLLLLMVIIVLFFLNFYSKTIFYRPCSMHQWRQADCLSITKNYYEEGMHFFQPKIHYQGPKGGNAVSECPILNYSVAALWKVFGEHEFIYRLLEYLIYIVSMFVLFNTVYRFFGSALLAFFTVIIFLTSPLLTFYSLNFIADVPALSIGIMSFCFFFNFYLTKRLGYFYAALFCGTLAVLMKASALIALSMLVFFVLIDLLNLSRIFKTEKLFQKKLFPAVTVGLSVILIILWYRFALAYNLNNANNIFLLTVLPMWEMQEEDIISNLNVLLNELFPVFLNRPMLFLFFVIVMYVIAKFKKLNALLKYSFGLAGFYFIFYLVFFFKVFSVHDYYLNNLMIFPVITLLCFAFIISQTEFLNTHSLFLRILVIVILIFNSFHAAAIYRLRMIEDDKLVQWYPFVSPEDRKLWKYLFWDYSRGVQRVENLTPVLRAHGISREDFVLSVPDQSFDISLYFMDQKGHAISRDHFEKDYMVTDHFKRSGIKYLVLSDRTLVLTDAFKRMAPHLESFFIHKKVEVFRIKKSFQQ